MELAPYNWDCAKLANIYIYLYHKYTYNIYIFIICHRRDIAMLLLVSFAISLGSARDRLFAFLKVKLHDSVEHGIAMFCCVLMEGCLCIQFIKSIPWYHRLETYIKQTVEGSVVIEGALAICSHPLSPFTPMCMLQIRMTVDICWAHPMYFRS